MEIKNKERDRQCEGFRPLILVASKLDGYSSYQIIQLIFLGFKKLFHTEM